MTTAADIARGLGGTKKGDEWLCRCPVHDDHDPSLSITEKGGKVLLRCRAGCANDTVLDELRRRGLWSETATERSRIAATYGYRDQDGQLRYQVVRLDPKSFRQRRPNGAPDAFIWNMQGVEALPYRLPEMLGDPDAIVYVVEGEKDADRLGELGLVATTNHGGALKWRPEISHWFTGRRVIIIPDNDEAGRNHAKDVARKLGGIASSIRILELPGLPEKGDVSDWIAAGGTADDMERLAAPKTGAAPSQAGGSHVDNDLPWPEPLGEAAYLGVVGDFVRLVGPQTEADPAALLFQFLAAAGNCFGDKAFYLMEQTRHYPNLFTVIAGDTAKARKGTARRWVSRVFTEADPKWQADCTTSGLSTGEGLIERVRDPIYEKDKKTGELELLDSGITDKRLLITEEEFSRPIRVMGRADNTLAAILREAWDGGRLGIMTRKRPITATGATVSIIAHITIAELRAELTETQAINGFANRFLFALATRSKLLPFGGLVSEGALSQIATRIKEASLRCPTGIVRFDEAARKLWPDAYYKLSEAQPGIYGAITARSEAQTIRVALIYALLDQQAMIGADHLTAALEIVRYANASVLHVFGDATGNRVADTLLRALRAAAPDGMTRTQITSELFSRNVQADDIARALATLAEASKIYVHHTATGGRPAEIWRAA